MPPPEPAPEPKLSRDVVLDAARALVAAKGLDALTVRAVAADLGVTPMALYRHVRDRDEILAAVVDDLLGAAGLPDEHDWRAWLGQLAVSLRQVFREHPVALGLFFRRPVTTPAARRRVEATSALLADCGFGPTEAIQAYAAVHTYTVGFSALEDARRTSRGAAPIDGADDPSSETIRAFVSDDQFEHGLRALIDGLAPAAR